LQILGCINFCKEILARLQFIMKKPTPIHVRQENCPMFWFSFSKKHCVSQEANLVPVHSLEEENFVKLLIRTFDPSQGINWIRLTDFQSYFSGWIWSDGCKYRFSRWDSGQPDNYRGNENCGVTNYGSNFYWNDGGCSIKFAFVCATRTVSH
uniref:C-type lectin domain-containing protein n=1 Tax=Poecilia latipinna TaxID=48699 RepID=A0A3B3V606_9TELE